MSFAGAVECDRRNERILDFPAIGSGIHSHTAADRTGNAREEFEPTQPRIGRGEGDNAVESRGAGADFITLDFDCREPSPQSDHDASNAAVAHEEVRAYPDGGHRSIRSDGG